MDRDGCSRASESRRVLTERRRCHLGCTSINLCWLKQVERWFVLINQRAIRSGSFHNVTELENTIQDFTDCHNASASHPSGISQLRPPSTRWRASLRVILRQETRSTCGMPSRSCRGTNAQPNTRKLCRGPHEEESSQPAILQHGQAKVGLGRRPEPSMPLASGKAGFSEDPRGPPPRCRFRASSGRDSHAKHRGPHAAPQDTQEGLFVPTRSAENGQQKTEPASVLEQEKPPRVCASCRVPRSPGLMTGDREAPKRHSMRLARLVDAYRSDSLLLPCTRQETGLYTGTTLRVTARLP